MVDSAKLRSKIDGKGIRYKFLAEQLGLSPYGFQLKVDGKNDFFSSEISKLCELLDIKTLKEKEAIFFAKTV